MTARLVASGVGRLFLHCRSALLLLTVVGACARTTADAGGGGDDEAPLVTTPVSAPPRGPAPADFAGSASCQSCHAEQSAQWRASTHGRAGGTPGDPSNPVTLIAPFNGAPLRFRNATVVPRLVAGRPEFLVERPGERDTVFRVTGVIGGGHMAGGGTQGFVTTWLDGTVRFLPFDWSRHSGTWFCHTATRANQGWQPIVPTMPLEACGDWPPARVLGDAPRFSNCQSCHGSGITVVARDSSTWQTTRRTLAIDCESCHGPAARHVALMKAGTHTTDIGLPALATLSKDESIERCMGCHALKTRIAPGYVLGASLRAYYALRLSQLGEQPYTPDGRTRTFAYQEGHLASDCYRNGGMTCTSCHDPHSQGYRTVDGTPIPGRTDDRQCTSCHASKAVAGTAHTKHPAASAGARCVSCHMPYEQQHELGRAIRYARSDHSIAIPRPALDDSLGLVGACAGCHTNRTPAALQAQVTAWWGTIKPHESAVRGALAARTQSDLVAATTSLLVPTSRHATAQVAGVAAWLERYEADPSAGQAAARAAAPLLRAMAASSESEVEALALAALQVSQPLPDVRRFLVAHAAPRGRDDRQQLRRQWGMVLGGLGDAARAAGRTDQARQRYRQALAVLPEDPSLLLNLGLAEAAAGDLNAAVRRYQQSLRQDPRQPMAEVNLGNALEALEDTVGAVAAYQRAIALDPVGPLGYLNLGTHYLRHDQASTAAVALERALARDPGLAAGHYQLALARLKLGDRGAAERSVRRSLAFDSTNANAAALAQALRDAVREARP
ncbi:MAG: tetratricopeptide repeat protein [Gemmatimonadaceae bacterium]